MKKKVGIMSMQRIFNYGSFLQAYGLKHILEDLGCEVCFVDYHPGRTLINSSRHILCRKILKVIDVLKQRGPLREKLRFIKYKKNFSNNYHPYLGINNERLYYPEVDVLIIGSDEVFNCVQDNTNVGFSPELFGYGNRAKKLISYAASFGNTTIEKLEQYNVKETVSAYLKQFDFISVRDNNSGVIIQQLTKKEPEYHMDPVLMYDFVEKCHLIPKTVPIDNYLILYGYSGRFTKEECKEIRKFADSKRLKILCVGGVQGCCDRFIDVDPFTVIAYFQHANYVITDTFHGTILSVITHKNFCVMVREQVYSNVQKISDLLERLGLQNAKIDNMKNIDRYLEKNIQYGNIDKIIHDNRIMTKMFLNVQVCNNGFN